MKIIKSGFPRRIICSGCECVFEVEQKDVRQVRWRGIGLLVKNQQFQGTGCKCPECGEWNQLA